MKHFVRDTLFNLLLISIVDGTDIDKGSYCYQGICVPKDYVKFELPPESPTVVYIGIDIKDIPKVRVLNIFLFKFIYAFFLILFPNAKEILLYLIIFHIWAYPTGYFQIYLHFLIVFPSILVSAGV